MPAFLFCSAQNLCKFFNSKIINGVRMKRSEYLVPLSWEHHSALVNANRIKLGVENKAPLSVIQEFVEYIWEHDLLPHFEREEEVILSREEADKIPTDIKERTLAEHQEFSTLFDQILQTAEEAEKKKLLKRFADLLVAHVRFEESEFFPSVEKEFSQEALKEIGKELKERHVPACFTWEPPFWKQ
ncbi:hypothetical protein DRI50_00410 [candidate division KSB1 bacterium]|nr:MAG: hypothetical protein DRI50_00410 [candidate division KSB1 bacterium]